MKVNITKNEFQIRKDEPNRVFHSYEGNIGDYTFTAETDNQGIDGINKGSIYELYIYNEKSNIARYNRKWEYRSKNTKDGAIRSTIIKYIDSISDKKDGEPKKFKNGGGVGEIEVPLRSNINGDIYEVIGVNYKAGKVRVKNFFSGKTIEMPIDEWIIESFERGTPASFMLNGRDVSGEVVLRNGQPSISLYKEYMNAGDTERIVPMKEIVTTLKPFIKKEMFSKGGNVIERRYVNKEQDYETRYAKDKPMRKGYKDERKFEGGGSITDRKTELIEKWIKPYSWGKVDENSGVVKTMASKYDLGVVTVAGLFNEHARKSTKKFAVGGEIGNQVNFRGDYGKKRSGIVTGKKNNGYVVSTDDGNVFVESYEIDSFEEAPIAKKKRFGFFEGGGSIEEYKQAERDYDKYGEYLEDAIEDENEADIKKYKKLMDEAETKMHRYERKYEGGGEIQSKIDKLNKVVNSKMLPESVKTKAKAEIEKLEKELHESKETKAEEKAEHEVGGTESKEKIELRKITQEEWNTKKKHDYASIKDGQKYILTNENGATILVPVEIVKAEAKEPKFKIGDVVGLDLDERTPKMITSFKTNRKGEIIYSGYYIPFPDQKWNYEESEIVLLKAPSKSEAKKPTTTSKKEIVGYAIVDPISADIMAFEETIPKLIEASKKLETKKGFEDIEPFVYEVIKKDGKKSLGNKITSVDINLLPIGKEEAKFKVGESVQIKDGLMEMIIDSYSTNRKGEIVYKGHFKSKPSEKFTEKESEIEVYKKPKPDHKKLLAKIKAKKGEKEYSNKASLVPFTDKRRKRSESSDRKREALPLGKRVSASGRTYWETRLNRGDISKEDKFEGGGSVGDERIKRMVQDWKKYGFAKSSVNKTNDDADFFKALKIDQDEVGITSQTGNDVIYYNTKVKNRFNRDIFKEGGEIGENNSGWGLKFLKW